MGERQHKMASIDSESEIQEMTTRQRFRLNNLFNLYGIPTTPGLYYFYNSNDELLYVGKAKKLRNRIFEHWKIHKEFVIYNICQKIAYAPSSDECKDQAIQAIPRKYREPPSSVPFDTAFVEASYVEIEEMAYQIISTMEKKKISELQPLYNVQ